jgi:hypothetical protein
MPKEHQSEIKVKNSFSAFYIAGTPDRRGNHRFDCGFASAFSGKSQEHIKKNLLQ